MKIPVLSVLEWLAVGVAVLIVGFMLWNFDPFHRRQHAEQAAATATVQAKTNEAAATIAGSAAVETRIIHERTEKVIHDVQQAPSATAPLPDDLRAAVCSGLSELRHGEPGCVDPGSTEPR